MAPALLRFGKKPSKRFDNERDKERSREIDKKLRKDQKKLGREIRVLLLGSSPKAYASTKGAHLFDCRRCR
jgi:hypothetical protein